MTPCPWCVKCALCGRLHCSEGGRPSPTHTLRAQDPGAERRAYLARKRLEGATRRRRERAWREWLGRPPDDGYFVRHPP